MRQILTFAILIFAIFVVQIKTFAAMPDISAGETHFDFSSGCYVLKNNVRVVARGRTMTANEAKVQIMSQKVWANGDVTLTQNGYSFKCDSIFVQGKLKTVDVLGNVDFSQDNIIAITSSVGQFSWGTKIADFYGKVNVKVSEGAQLTFGEGLVVDENGIDGEYDHVQYNVRESKILLLEKHVDSIPITEFPEPDPTEAEE